MGVTEMIPRKFSRSTVIQLIIGTALFMYLFHADITDAGTWINQTFIQPNAQIFPWIFGIAFGAFAGWGIWIAYEAQVRKYGWKLLLWGLLWYDIIAGMYYLLVGLWWIFIYFLALWWIPWLCLTELALKEQQKQRRN